MSGGGIRDGGGDPGRLDVDDQEMWDAARRAPLPAQALHRIAANVRSQQRRMFAGPRWRVWATASLLLLIGGAAGAAVATIVIRRPSVESLREAVARATRASSTRGHRERSPEPPAVALTAAPAPTAKAQPAPTVVASELPARIESPARAAVAPRRRAPPVQLALSAPAQPARTTASPPALLPSPPPPSQPASVAPSLGPPPARAPEAPPPTGPSAEAGILRAALTALHRNDDPAAALALLDQYDARFPRGTLRGEATLARAHSLRELGRDDDLLRLLERVSFADVPRAAELRVLRGELRLTRRRFGDALGDFDAALVAGAPDSIAERALFGRASCRSRMGDTDGARTDLRRYLERFPASPRAAEVRASLAR